MGFPYSRTRNGNDRFTKPINVRYAGLNRLSANGSEGFSCCSPWFFFLCDKSLNGDHVSGHVDRVQFKMPRLRREHRSKNGELAFVIVKLP